MLRIFVLGSVRVQNDEPYREIRLTHTTQALLAYLILQGAHPCSRQVLAGVFWGDSPEASARSCLNTALWRLRLALEDHKPSTEPVLLSTPGGEICLNPARPLWVDALAFEDAVKPALAHPEKSPQPGEIAELEKCLKLYRGDLLESFYDDWALGERERMRLLHLSAMECLMRCYQQCGDLERSLETGLQILRQDPLREEIHRAVMRLYHATGRRAQAVLQYEHCRSLIRQELGIDPMPETQALVARIQAGDAFLDEPPTLPSAALLRQESPSLPAAVTLDEVQSCVLQAQQTFSQAQRQLTAALELLEKFTGRRAS
jgi:DNA-binding SARP family transcriptional activator